MASKAPRENRGNMNKYLDSPDSLRKPTRKDSSTSHSSSPHQFESRTSPRSSFAGEEQASFPGPHSSSDQIYPLQSLKHLNMEFNSKDVSTHGSEKQMELEQYEIHQQDFVKNVKKRTAGQRFKRHCARYWWFHIVIFCIIFLLTTLLL
jgi:hypothetical protein